MKKILAIILTLIAVRLAAQNNPDNLLMYVGTMASADSEGVHLLQFDPGTGKLSEKQVFKGLDNPSFLNISADRGYLYVVTRAPREVEPSGGYIVAFKIRTDGSLTFINKQPSHGAGPCYVDVSPSGKFVAIANYTAGSIAVYPVDEAGALMPATSVIKHEGSGPVAGRQGEAHAHSIRFSRYNDLVFSADLGIDKLMLYRLNSGDGSLKPSNPPYAPLAPGSGPRHFDFSEGEKFCYVLNELSSTLTVFKNENGGFSELQTLPTLPEDFSGINTCADIHVSADNRFVYASNRGHNSIAVFSRAGNGLLTFVTHVSVQGDWPRNFTLDPTGNFLLVANQRSHNITVFRLEKGIPVFTGEEIKVSAPVCLKFW